jgi:hypothetical protein
VSVVPEADEPKPPGAIVVNAPPVLEADAGDPGGGAVLGAPCVGNPPG